MTVSPSFRLHVVEKLLAAALDRAAFAEVEAATFAMQVRKDIFIDKTRLVFDRREAEADPTCSRLSKSRPL